MAKKGAKKATKNEETTVSEPVTAAVEDPTPEDDPASKVVEAGKGKSAGLVYLDENDEARLKRKNTSDVWKYIELLSLDQITVVNNGEENQTLDFNVRCKSCNWLGKYKSSNGTSGLRSHINRCAMIRESVMYDENSSNSTNVPVGESQVVLNHHKRPKLAILPSSEDPRGRKNCSDVWNFIDLLSNDDINELIESPNYVSGSNVRCKTCGWFGKYKSSNGTSGLRSHIKRCIKNVEA